MLLAQALGMVLKRVVAGELKGAVVKKLAKDIPDLTPFVEEIDNLVDDDAGLLKPEAVQMVKELNRKYIPLFAGVDIEKYVPKLEPLSEDSPVSKALKNRPLDRN